MAVLLVAVILVFMWYHTPSEWYRQCAVADEHRRQTKRCTAADKENGRMHRSDTT